MTTGYTQGEWVLLRGGIEVQSETNEHEIFAYVGEHPVAIASVLPHLESEHDMPVSNYSMSKEEGMANAKLIAAAPALLQALQSLLIEAGTFGIQLDNWAVVNAQQAIYKAIGVDKSWK
jgi:hypothetical protein